MTKRSIIFRRILPAIRVFALFSFMIYAFVYNGLRLIGVQLLLSIVLAMTSHQIIYLLVVQLYRNTDVEIGILISRLSYFNVYLYFSIVVMTVLVVIFESEKLELKEYKEGVI